MGIALGFSVRRLFACAGGTRGTGGVEYRGRVILNDDSPLSDVQVTLLDTGVDRDICCRRHVRY